MADLPLSRRLAAEFVGTALLTAAVIGSGLMAARLTDDAAIALLANTLATAAALAVLIATLAPVSGAHLNPAVTLAFALRRDIAPPHAALYVAAQFAGALGGAALAALMFEVPMTPATAAHGGVGEWSAEIVATFGLVAVILAASRQRPRDLPWLVAGWIAAAYWFTASTAFANPALTIARSLVDGMTGIRPADVPAFLAVQIAGAALAAIALGRMMRPVHHG
ncbi:MAG: aquaporin [Bauldia sp.]|nr:aquaporin [Bauldia sp.]